MAEQTEQLETKVEQPPETTQPQTTTAPAESPEATKEEDTPQKIDWRRFKEARKVERQQKEDAERRAAQRAAEADALRAAMEALVNKGHAASSTGQENTEDKSVKQQIEEALAQERQRVKQERLEQEQSEFPQKLAQTYQDFDQVCNADNLDYLEFHHPETAAAFKLLPEGFDKWSKIYKAIKRYIPNNADHRDQKKAERNLQKPQSMAASGRTGTGDTAPRTLDDKRRDDNWKRMQRVMKGG